MFSKYSRIQVLAELVLLMALKKMAKKRRSLRRWRGSIASNKASWVTCENAECVKMYHRRKKKHDSDKKRKSEVDFVLLC